MEVMVGASGVVEDAAPYPIAVVILSNSNPDPPNTIRVK
jgi:hypothetical protein